MVSDEDVDAFIARVLLVAVARPDRFIARGLATSRADARARDMGTREKLRTRGWCRARSSTTTTRRGMRVRVARDGVGEWI